MELKEDLKVIRTPTVFFIRLPNNKKAYLAYRTNNDVLELIETYTPPEYRGKGIAGLMIREAIKFAKENKLKIRPICSYAIYYFKKYQDLRDVLVDELKTLDESEWDKLFNERLKAEKEKKRKNVT